MGCGANERIPRLQPSPSWQGQGSFRVLVTDTYHRQCAVTGEKALPVLDAAHVRGVADGGDHRIDNGEPYYPFDGQEIWVPKEHRNRPNREFLEWHADTRFRG